jgi:hypothetical protein
MGSKAPVGLDTLGMVLEQDLTRRRIYIVNVIPGGFAARFSGVATGDWLMAIAGEYVDWEDIEGTRARLLEAMVKDGQVSLGSEYRS